MARKTFDGEAQLDLLIRICADMVRRKALRYNPAAAFKATYLGRGDEDGGGGPTLRAILPREVVHPETVERIRLQVKGAGILLFQYRLLVTILAYLGLRPSEAVALRWHNVFERPGIVRRYLHVDSAVKDLAGRLEEGETKTHEPRDVLIWPVVAQEFVDLWQRQGCPPLDALVLPNKRGAFMDYGNWRGRAWYQALKRAGICEQAKAKAKGAFVPYCLRHTCATLMKYALKEPGSLATYPSPEIAVQLGNTTQTLEKVYVKILRDDHDVAGLTMDEAVRRARRAVWGPAPGDDDYQEVRLTLAQAAEIATVTLNTLHVRAKNGQLETTLNEKGHQTVTRHELLTRGLLLPDGGGGARADEGQRPDDGPDVRTTRSEESRSR